jgi:hypothetical protein
MENLEHLAKRFEESKEDFIECEALQHGGYSYIVAQKRQQRKPRQKKWYLWVEPWGKIRGSVYQPTPGPSDKEILLTDNPDCKDITKISGDFFFARNNYYDAHKRLLFDPETNTVFSYQEGRLSALKSEKVLCQIFEVESEN